MGITLTADDFVRVSKEPLAVLIGFVLCYGLMPALGIGLGKAFGLPLDLVAGLTLVGAVNGGQASNLCTYIAKGDVALSVLMTTVTTIAGIVVTPLLCKVLLGAVVPIDALGIAKSCMQVVLAPIVLGMSLNKLYPKTVEKNCSRIASTRCCFNVPTCCISCISMRPSNCICRNQFTTSSNASSSDWRPSGIHHSENAEIH